MTNLQSNLKKQLDSIKAKVVEVEKTAEKQVKSAFKNTEKFRAEQLKHVHALIKKAQNSKQGHHIVEAADRLKSDLEGKASAGFDLLLAKLNLPNKKEIDRLNKRISALQKRVEELEITPTKKPTAE